MNHDTDGDDAIGKIVKKQKKGNKFRPLNPDQITNKTNPGEDSTNKPSTSRPEYRQGENIKQTNKQTITIRIKILCHRLSLTVRQSIISNSLQT